MTLPNRFSALIWDRYFNLKLIVKALRPPNCSNHIMRGHGSCFLHSISVYHFKSQDLLITSYLHFYCLLRSLVVLEAVRYPRGPCCLVHVFFQQRISGFRRARALTIDWIHTRIAGSNKGVASPLGSVRLRQMVYGIILMEYIRPEIVVGHKYEIHDDQVYL